MIIEAITCVGDNGYDYIVPRGLWDAFCPLFSKHYVIALVVCAFSNTSRGCLLFLKHYGISLPNVPEALWDTWVMGDNVG